jgi:hypothetical protein
MEVLWGQVTSVGSPLGVRIAGDSVDTLVGQRSTDYTPVEGDKVVLVKAGSRGGYVVAFKVVDA